MILFLDLMHKFHMLLSSKAKCPIFFNFTYNHGKCFLILPIIKGNMYTWPPIGVAPPPSEVVGEKSPGYPCFKDYNDGVPTDIRK